MVHGEVIIRFFDRVVYDGMVPPEHENVKSHIRLPVTGRSGNARPKIVRTDVIQQLEYCQPLRRDRVSLKGFSNLLQGESPTDSTLQVYYNPFWVPV